MDNIKKHIPSDIEISFDVDKYDELEEVWKKYSDGFDLPDFLLFLALMGIESNRKINRNEKNGSKTHNFSRTVYQRNTVEMESIIGLITILSNLDGDDDEIVNKRAFAKMNTLNMPFAQLPNINDFYSRVIGGIAPSHDLIFKYGNRLNDISSAIFDEIIDRDDQYQELVEQLVLEELEEYKEN